MCVAFEGRPATSTTGQHLLSSAFYGLRQAATQKEADTEAEAVMKHHLTMETPTSDTPSHQPMIRKPAHCCTKILTN
jgi:hypothetical protein